MAKTTTQSRQPRGIRNNNPLNIRISGQRWRGKVDHNTDGSFEQFVDMIHGIRAAIVIVRTYISRHHLDTPRQIIQRWAPESENQVEAYIKTACEKAHLTDHQRISINSKNAILRLLWGMTQVENGKVVPYTDFEAAWAII